MVRSFLTYVCLSVLASQAYSQDFILESDFNDVFYNEVVPLWEANESISLPGTAFGLFHQNPVSLSCKEFIQDGAKANIFIVPGFNNYKEIFRELTYDFIQRDFNVIVCDLRGHGRSTRLSPNNYVYFDSYENLARDLRIVVEELGVDNLPNLAYSFSMGGLITAIALIQDQDLFSGVAMASPLFEFDSSPYPLIVAQVIVGASTLFGAGDELAIGQEGPSGQPGPFEEASNTSLVRWQAAVDYKYAPENLDEVVIAGATNNWVFQTIKAINKVMRPWNRPKIKVPIKLYQATQDTVVLLPGQNKFCDGVSNCELVVSSQSRHEIYNETDSIRIPHLTDVIQFFDEVVE